MNFRLGPRDKTDHPDWLPVSLQAVLFGTLAVCLMGFFLELPLFFIAGPIILALFIILPLPRFVGGLLITLLLIGLVYLEQHHFPSVSAGILLAASIGILGTLLRETLLKNEWKFAALSLWQAIDESKASSGEIIAGEVLKSVRQLVRNDITIALRELDPLSADIYISDPPDVFPLKILPPDIYKKSSANNEILFINNYDAEQEQNRYLKEIGAQSLVIVPLRYSGKIRGAVLLIWRRKNAISAFMQNFLELIFERLYASLTIADASHRLDKLQAQYDAILKTMPQGVAFVDENGAQNWVNHAAAKLLDIKEGPVEPKDFAMAMAQLRTSADNIKEIVEESMQLFKTKNASIRDWEWDFSTMRDQIICVSTTPANSETSAGRLWIFEDVTDRKRAEEAVKISNRNLELSLKKLEILNEQLVELNKEKNEFLGIAAHDLKNPLSAILGLSNILLEDSETITPQETQEYTKMIVDSAERMFELIKKLLDVNAIEEGRLILKKERVEFSMIAEIAKQYNVRHAEGKHIQIIYTRPDFSTAVAGDENAITQVLDNLISNAVKYSPPLSKVYMWFEAHGQAIRFTIKDEGPGLTEKDKNNLFKKFSRLSAQPTGGESSTGLGLSIVKRLVEQMNGTIICESIYGRGASFIVDLPVFKE